MKRSIAGSLVAVSLLAACGASPDGEGEAGVGAQGSALTAQRSYWLVANDGAALPANLAARVTAAGGTVTRTLSSVGAAIATSSSATFQSNAAKIAGLRAVAPSMTWSLAKPAKTTRMSAAASQAYAQTAAPGDFLLPLQWGMTAVHAADAWTRGSRGAGARVAVIDSGCDYTHPDLAPNVNVGLSVSFVPGEGVLPLPGTEFDHGTHVAGIIAAAANEFGVVGVAPEAELVCVKVFSAAGTTTDGDIFGAMLYAAQIGADVANMSFGGSLKRSGACDASGCYTAKDANELIVLYNRVANYVHGQGTLLVAAAGNESTDFDHTANLTFIPAQMPHVVTVSATGPKGWAVNPAPDLDVPAFYTNYGSSAVDQAGPGGNVDFDLMNSGAMCGPGLPCWALDMVLSTVPGGWGWAAGTSMASPHVAGVAALIVGNHGGRLAPDQVAAALRASADDLGKPGNDPWYGLGRVNAGAASLR